MPPLRYDQLFDLIGKIYDCVIEPTRWENTLEDIRLAFTWHNAILSAIPLDGRRATIQVILGVPDVYREIANSGAYHASILDLWGGP